MQFCIVQSWTNRKGSLHIVKRQQRVWETAITQDLQFLQSEGVLRNAKDEYKNAQYLDPDPIKALAILKRQTNIAQNVIHDIGYDPFYLYFWSSHQRYSLTLCPACFDSSSAAIWIFVFSTKKGA